MKNILLYTDTPQTGGAELQMFLLAKFLNKNKFNPILACSNFPQLDKWCENFKKENIQVIRLNVKHKHDIKHYSQLKKIIKTNNINIFHSHLWNPASCRYGFLAASSTKTPIIITEHDPFKLSYIKGLFKKFVLNKTNKIIAVSENNKKILEELYPKHKNKIKVITNGIDITWWKSQILRLSNDEKQKIKEKIFKASSDTLIITTIATLHKRKGINYLIQGISEVIKEFPNIKLAIIGEGPEKENLEKLNKKLKTENHIIFLGKQAEIPKLLKSSEIFCLPSIREAFGLVNLEAMAMSRPIIATKVGGIPEIIDHNKNGILIEPKTPLAITNALKELISDPEKRVKLGQNGHKKLLEKFDAIKVAEEYEKVYESI